MTKQVKSFTAPINDEYGGRFEDAVVSVRDWVVTRQDKGSSPDLIQPYEIVTGEILGLTHKSSFWYNGTTKAQGEMSRPLRQKDGDGGLTDVFEVDLEAEEIKLIFDGAGDTEERILAAIAKDTQLRFR